MNIEEAKQNIIDIWLIPAKSRLGCEVHLDDSLTEEYSWGWVFHIVVTDLATFKINGDAESVYAVDSETGKSMPVGPKGIKYTRQLMTGGGF